MRYSKITTTLAVWTVCLAGPAAADDLSRAETVIQKAFDSYERLEGYQAVFTREATSGERIENFMKFEKPFTVYMNWIEGERRGLELLYARDRFDGKMLVRPPGFMFSFIPLVYMDTEDPRVLKGSGHSIKTAGVGVFLERLRNRFGDSRAAGRLTVRAVTETEVEGEPCTLVDLEFDNPDYPYRRMAVAFSDIHDLPVRMDLYRNPETLTEVHRYARLALNPERTDPAFRNQADPRLFEKFQGLGIRD